MNASGIKMTVFWVAVGALALALLVYVVATRASREWFQAAQSEDLSFQEELLNHRARIAEDPCYMDSLPAAFMRAMGRHRVPIDTLTGSYDFNNINDRKIWSTNARLLILILEKLGVSVHQAVPALIEDLVKTDPTLLTIGERHILAGALEQFSNTGDYHLFIPREVQGRMSDYYHRVVSCDS